jgi:hypothetical protein
MLSNSIYSGTIALLHRGILTIYYFPLSTIDNFDIFIFQKHDELKKDHAQLSIVHNPKFNSFHREQLEPIPILDIVTVPTKWFPN